jgi:hypothetical protein
VVDRRVAAAIVREIFERVAAGESCVRIADDLAMRGLAVLATGWTRAGGLPDRQQALRRAASGSSTRSAA